jgi:hypothetical protein
VALFLISRGGVCHARVEASATTGQSPNGFWLLFLFFFFDRSLNDI